MNNTIDELLGEIDKFKTNLANSNELMDLLKNTTKRIGEYEISLIDENGKSIKQVEDSNKEILEFRVRLIDEHTQILQKPKIGFNEINTKNNVRSKVNNSSMAGVNLDMYNQFDA